MSPQLPDIEAPPLEPIGEVVADEHSEFSARCLSLVTPYIGKSNWEFLWGLVTSSPKWGLIWRGDYAIALRHCRQYCATIRAIALREAVSTIL